MRRSSSVTAYLVAALLVFTACSDSEPRAESEPTTEAPSASVDPDPDTPSGEPSLAPDFDAVAGFYKAKTNIVRSDLPGSTNKVGNKQSTNVIASCADDACADVHLRGDDDDGGLSRPFLLQNDGGVLTGSGVRRGPCTETQNPEGEGEFTETVTFNVTVNDETLDGSYAYAFVGCGFDGKAMSMIRGALKSEVPYLNESDAAALAPAVTAYDVAVGELYAQGADCNAIPGFAGTARCFDKALTPWLATFDGLQNGLDAALPSASQSCSDQVGKFELTELRRQITETISALSSPKTQVRGVNELLPALFEFLSTEHVDLVTALVTCIDPSNVGLLGENGTLAVDVVASRLPVLPAP